MTSTGRERRTEREHPAERPERPAVLTHELTDPEGGREVVFHEPDTEFSTAAYVAVDSESVLDVEDWR